MITDHSKGLFLPPLQNASTQIRLLQILPKRQRNNEELIRCNLSVHNHSDVYYDEEHRYGKRASNSVATWLAKYFTKSPTEYIAISYTWGNSPLLKYITVNGVSIPIRYNCWYALRQMRLHNTGMFFWIDSICIDQDSVEEKRHQIAMMATIYLGAAKVAVCVGPSAPADEVLFQSDSGEGDSVYHRAFMAFVKRSYFQRLWTVHERLLPSPNCIQAFCGDKVAEWTRLKDLVWRVWRKGEREFPHWGRDNSRWFRRFCLPHFDHVVLERSIDAAINDYAQLQCADPRDKIFGLLALVPKLEARRLARNAGRPYLEVLVEFWCPKWLRGFRKIMSCFLASPKSEDKTRFKEDLLEFLRWHWADTDPGAKSSAMSQYCHCQTGFSPHGDDIARPVYDNRNNFQGYCQDTVCHTISSAVLREIVQYRNRIRVPTERQEHDDDDGYLSFVTQNDDDEDGYLSFITQKDDDDDGYCSFITQDPALNNFVDAVISERGSFLWWEPEIPYSQNRPSVDKMVTSTHIGT